MKRWALLTVLIYLLVLLLLTVPVLLVAFGGWEKKGDVLRLHDALKIFLFWGFWLWLAVLVAGQALLLLLPISLAERRLPARRPLKIPIIVAAFFLANLFVAGIFSALCLILRDNALYAFSFLDLLCRHASSPSSSVELTGWGFFTSAAIVLGAFWLVWAAIFRSFAKSDDPDALLRRSTRWLLRGSILELLVAVPSHVIVRRRDDCCAPLGTFWGIVTGLSVMLLCFGPGVFFLFAERFKRLRPGPAAKNTPP